MGVRFNTLGDVWTEADPHTRIMQAKVIAAASIDGVPRAVGEIVEVDEHTLHNLVRKGRLVPVETKGRGEEDEPEFSADEVEAQRLQAEAAQCAETERLASVAKAKETKAKATADKKAAAEAAKAAKAEQK